MKRAQLIRVLFLILALFMVLKAKQGIKNNTLSPTLKALLGVPAKTTTPNKANSVTVDF